MNLDELSVPSESFLSSSNLRPFTRKAIAERIERISVAVKTGNEGEVKKILWALESRNQNITQGFDLFVEQSSDLKILKTIRPLLEVIEVKHFHHLLSALIKHSKLRLVLSLLESAGKQSKFEPDSQTLHFAVFKEMFNTLPIERFFDAVEYLTANKVNLRFPSYIMVFEKMLSLSDDESRLIIEKLVEIGIDVTIKKTQIEQDKSDENDLKFRSITSDDFSHSDWYERINSSSFIPATRNFYKALKLNNEKEALRELENIGNTNRGISRIIGVVIECVELGRLPITEVNSIIISSHMGKQQISINDTLQWAEFVFNSTSAYLIESFENLARKRDVKTGKRYLLLDFRSIIDYLQENNWDSQERALNFIEMIKILDHASDSSITTIGYFLREAPYAMSAVFLKNVENILGYKLDKFRFGLLLKNLADHFDEDSLRSMLIFGKERNLLDHHNYIQLYKVGLLNLRPDIIQIVLREAEIESDVRSGIRQSILKFEMASGNTDVGLELFAMSADIKDQDPFDAVITIQNCIFKDLVKVESLLMKYLPKGLPFNVIAVGCLCNRYSRNNNYEEVLRVLKEYKPFFKEDDTILQLYKLAAYSNLNQNENARNVLSLLIDKKDDSLVQKYAPSILRKIENRDLSSLLKSLNLELKESIREYKIPEVLELTSGIIRN